MLLTFVFERYSGFRLRSRYLSEKGLLATDESYDAMVKVTEEHIIANIPDLIDIELIISRVDRGESSNEKMETLVLMGTLYFTAEAATADILPDLSPASVRRQVEDVFDNNVSVLRYIHALRKSDQAAFNDIVLVYPGIVSPNSQIQGSTSNEDESFWKSFFFNWENPVWIVVAAGISAAVLGLCAVFSFTCYLRSEHRRGLDHQHLATRKSDDTSKTAGERNPYNVEDSVHDDENSVNGPGDMSEIGYQASEVTSVYSYIDNNNTMMDDQSFSVAPSYTFPGTEYDDNRSVLWSVIDDAKDNDILDDLDSTAGASPPSRQKTGYTSRMGVPERQSSEDSDDDMFSLLSRNNDRTQVLETNATNESVLQGSPPTPQNVISSQKTHAAVDDAISKHSPDSSSGASHASRESLNKISNMIPGFRSKRNNVKTSSNYQQLDESYGSHHSWDKELGIQPSPDDLDDESVFLDDSEEGETIVSQLAPLSSIHKISSGGDKEDSDVPLNETAKSRDDDSSVESGDLQEGHLAPAQFIVPVSESAETGFLGTKSEDTTHSDGKDSNSSEKENISSDALPDGESNNFDCSFSEAEISPENNNEKPEQRRSDDTNAPPLAEKPECSHNFNNSDNRDDAANPVIVMASKEKSDMDWSPNKEQVQEAPTDITDDEPTNPVNEEEVPAINTLASF